MKVLPTIFKSVAVACMLSFCSVAWAANTKNTVSQITTTVDVTDDVDYIVTSETPFETDGKVNIVNTDHAVLILAKVKPSAAISLLANHVQIDGKKAVNNSNCQVKIYNQGCIILPYSSSIKPLKVYSEKNFGGTEVNSLTLGHTGGFMKTLTASQLNNKIRSFKLKRGYMVTFALRAGGRGYSRCFIAADQDLEVSELPPILDRSISSYRIFKWYDTGKKGLANDTRQDPVSKLNVTSCYSFGLGESRLPDCECVPHHIYEDWPSASSCGSIEYSPHLKTNNEPGNSADDHPQTVKQILDNWESLMRTGMRICSPSSHDGSLSHLREFLDSIDARGWRCDIIDLHCYWPESSFNEWSFKTQWVEKYHRPIWVSEWVWGASWNNNGAFANGVTEAQNATNVKKICETMNNMEYVERYYYWNSERDPSKIYKEGGTLTEAGEYYSEMDPGLAYNPENEYIPQVPPQGSPKLKDVNIDDGTITLTWYDSNGEQNSSMTVERRTSAGEEWTVLADIDMKETASTYTYQDTEYNENYYYRIHVVDANGTDHYAETICSTNLSPGEKVYAGGRTCYLGGNIIGNSRFIYGMTGWTSNGTKALTFPNFEIITASAGGESVNALKALKHSGKGGDGSIGTYWTIDAGTDYLFSVFSNLTPGGWQKACLSTDGTDEALIVYELPKNSQWTQDAVSFNSDIYTKFALNYRWLESQAEFTKFYLGKLFDTEEEAIADGMAKGKDEWTNVIRPYYEQLDFAVPAGLTKQSMIDNINAQIEAASTYNEIQEIIGRLDELVGATADVSYYNNVTATAEALYSTDNRDKFTCSETDIETLKSVIDGSRNVTSLVELKEQTAAVTKATFTFLNQLKIRAGETLDITGFFVNTGFDEGSNGWTISNNTGDNNYNYSAVEFYQSQFDINQTLTGLPAEANVVVRVQGFQRPGTADAAWNAYGNSSDKTKNATTVIYANSTTQKIKNIMSETSTTITKNTSKVGGSRYVPNGMEGARLFFDSKLDDNAYYYENELAATTTLDGTLKIGIRNTTSVSYDWTLFDNFRIGYAGRKVTVTPGDVNGDGVIDIVDVTSTISHILGQTPQDFDEEAADVNGDKKVDIVDVTSIIDIILNK